MRGGHGLTLAGFRICKQLLGMGSLGCVSFILIDGTLHKHLQGSFLCVRSLVIGQGFLVD